MQRIFSTFITGSLVLCILSLWSCSSKKEIVGDKELTVLVSDSFSISKATIENFENKNEIKIKIVKSGDVGTLLTQAILTKNNASADLIYGIDNTFMSRALNEDLFEVYQSPKLAKIDSSLILDKSYRLLPCDFGEIALNFDKKWFAEKKIATPATLEELTNSVYKNLLVVENPATSSPGLAFLLATIGKFGEANYLDYWKKLKDNGVLVVNGWKDAYWTHFSAASKGDRPIVVSYSTSPAAEVFYANGKISEAPTSALILPSSTIRQVEFVGILKNSKKQELAKKFVDYMLDTSFQEDIPLNMFVYPANIEAKLPEVFQKFSTKGESPIAVSAEEISSKRDLWIESWTQAVLKNQ